MMPFLHWNFLKIPSSETTDINFYSQDLSRNRLTEFPVELSDFIMLERLDLYHNAVRSLPDLSPLKALKYLNLR